VPRLSPNGKMIARDRLGPQSNKRDIWLYDLVRGTEQRFTFAGNNMLPIWSPDGLRVAYTNWRDSVTRSDGKIIVRAADGTGQEEVLEVADKAVSAWTRDGAYLLTATSTFTPKPGNDIWALPLTGPNARKPVVLRQTEFNENWGEVSPDGKWLAYRSDESAGSPRMAAGFPCGVARGVSCTSWAWTTN
jgi:Tol biopolymer transport system component